MHAVLLLQASSMVTGRSPSLDGLRVSGGPAASGVSSLQSSRGSLPARRTSSAGGRWI
jgi:hypothetical protein